jgi:uncharacterized protein YndB with AHSA1/START domain
VQRVEVERVFAVPPAELWRVYTDHARWKEWAGFRDSWLEREGAPDRNGAGCVRGFSGLPGQAVFEEVLEFEPPRRMTYRLVRGGLPIRDHLGEVLLEPDAGGTRLVWRCRFVSKLPGLGGVIRRGIRYFFARALDGLARHLAAASGPPTR